MAEKEQYRVAFEIDVDGLNPVDAAQEAWAILTDCGPLPIATVTKNGISEDIDLEQEGLGDEE